VVLSNILADPINSYATDFRFSVVEEINGRKIKKLEDVAEAFAEPAEFYVIRFIGEGRPIVLEANAVKSSSNRIVERYNVTRTENLQP